jgi:hypothetical protein
MLCPENEASAYNNATRGQLPQDTNPETPCLNWLSQRHEHSDARLILQAGMLHIVIVVYNFPLNCNFATILSTASIGSVQ